MKRWWCLWVLPVLAGFGCAVVTAGEPPTGEFPLETVKVGETPRTFRLVVPKSVDPMKPAPLVVAFHGMGIDSKDLMPRYSELNKTSEQHRFLLAYPEAEGRSFGLAPQKVEADLRFFDALVENIAGRYNVDRDRIFALGISNGGYFAHLVGKERSNTVAAVVSHSGPLGLQTLAGIRAERKFPVMIIHGTEDRLFPVSIARENRDKYRSEGHFVEYRELAGVGHRWGPPAETNEAIWKFFDEHPLKKN